MHIVIYGVGAVGGSYGTLLARYIKDHPEHKISFIARGQIYQTLKTSGIELERIQATDLDGKPYDEIIKRPVTVYQGFDEIASDVDVVLVCVKSRDTIAVAESIKGKLRKDAYVVSVQNGVENEERLASVLGSERVLGCYTNVAAQNVEPGKYLLRGRYQIVFGELPGNEHFTRATDLVELMRAAKMEAKLSTDIYKDLWSKLVWNTGFNPLSALYELEIGPLIAQHQDTILGLMRETREVAHAQGIMIRDDIVEFHFNHTNAPIWDHFRTSMMQDALAGKPIELEEILGVLIRRGKEFSVATPYAEQVYELCRAKFSQPV